MARADLLVFTRVTLMIQSVSQIAVLLLPRLPSVHAWVAMQEEEKKKPTTLLKPQQIYIHSH